MTGPRVDTAVPRIPTLEEFEASQYAGGTSAALALADPAHAKTKVPALSRIPTLEEFEAMQGMTSQAIKSHTLPALPVLTDFGDRMSMAPRDVSRTPMDLTTRGKTATEWAFESKGAAGVVDNLLAPLADHPWMSAGAIGATMIPVVGPWIAGAMAGEIVSTMGLYGYQKTLEMQATPEARKIMEADKERITGEAAIAQGIMLGLIGAHAVGKAVGKASGVNGGAAPDAMELPLGAVGRTARDLPRIAESVREAQHTAEPRFVPRANDVRGMELSFEGTSNQRFAAGIERGAEEAALGPGERPVFRAPEGLEPSTGASAPKRQPRPVEGLETPLSVRARRIKALETEPLAKTAEERAARHSELLKERRAYEAERLVQDEADLSADRSEAAAKIAQADAMRPRRRAAKLLETEDGAEMLGTAAAQHGLPADASPFIPESPKDVAWKTGHESVTSGATPEGFTPTAEPLPEFPEGFSMGGSLRDSRIPGKGELPKVAKGSNSAGEPAPVADPVAAESGLAPVAGTGPTRTRGLSAGVEAKAVENKLGELIGDLPEYNQVSMADQAVKATSLLESDPALARRVALAEAPAPDGLLPESVFVAVENKAILDGDAVTLRDLANGKLSTEATTMGQRIRALGERDPSSPVGAIQSVNAKLSAGRNVEKPTLKTVKEIEAHFKDLKVAETAWNAFIDSLRC